MAARRAPLVLAALASIGRAQVQETSPFAKALPLPRCSVENKGYDPKTVNALSHVMPLCQFDCAKKCQEQCGGQEGCLHYMYYKNSGGCWLFGSDAKLVDLPGVISGDLDCADALPPTPTVAPVLPLVPVAAPVLPSMPSAPPLLPSAPAPASVVNTTNTSAVVPFRMPKVGSVPLGNSTSDVTQVGAFRTVPWWGWLLVALGVVLCGVLCCMYACCCGMATSKKRSAKTKRDSTVEPMPALGQASRAYQPLEAASPLLSPAMTVEKDLEMAPPQPVMSTPPALLRSSLLSPVPSSVALPQPGYEVAPAVITAVVRAPMFSAGSSPFPAGGSNEVPVLSPPPAAAAGASLQAPAAVAAPRHTAAAPPQYVETVTAPVQYAAAPMYYTTTAPHHAELPIIEFTGPVRYVNASPQYPEHATTQGPYAAAPVRYAAAPKPSVGHARAAQAPEQHAPPPFMEPVAGGAASFA